MGKEADLAFAVDAIPAQLRLVPGGLSGNQGGCHGQE
jgi:hypothetical protein